MSADDVRRVAAHLDECRPCLAEYDLDSRSSRSCGAPARARPRRPAVRLQIMQRITMVRLDARRLTAPPPRRHDENTRYAVRPTGCPSASRSGVGLAAVVGLVALARAALAGALAHGVPFVGGRVCLSGACGTRKGSRSLSHTAVHARLDMSGSQPSTDRTTASERNLPCASSAPLSPSPPSPRRPARPCAPPRPPPPTRDDAYRRRAYAALDLDGADPLDR